MMIPDKDNASNSVALGAASPVRLEETEGYGNARCRCGHVSNRHNCDHATGDDSCFDCDCDSFCAPRVQLVPATGPSLRADLRRVVRFALEHGDDETENAAIRVRLTLDGGVEAALAAGSAPSVIQKADQDREDQKT
jgi:hypothetical protein